MTGGTVCLTFDLDAIAGALGRGQLTATPISRGEFAAVAVPRLLHLLASRGITSTWFVPGHTALVYPELVAEIVAADHEVAVHGHAHRNVAAMEEADERSDLECSLQALKAVTGELPRGFRAPAWDLSDHSVALLTEHGLIYDSSLMGHDYAPYPCRLPDEVTDDGIRWGEPTSLIEVPVSWSLDDFPHLEFMRSAAGTLPGLRNPQEMFTNWTGDLDYMLRDVRDGVLTVTMHPEVIGRGHRLLALERWLDHVVGRQVTFSTAGDVAQRYAAGKAFGIYAPR
jgi:peptidoglycan/xylan/chitin deacetylase (PgdA/CDA1 family)